MNTFIKALLIAIAFSAVVMFVAVGVDFKEDFIAQIIAFVLMTALFTYGLYKSFKNKQ